MATSSITVKGIVPNLPILGEYQRFIFDISDPIVSFQLDSSFTPTNEISSQVNFEFRDNTLSGYRFNYKMYQNDSKFGHLTLQGFENNEATGVNFFTIDEEELITFFTPLSMDNYNIVQLADPIANQDAANKQYVDNAIAASGGSGIVYPGGTTQFLRSDGQWSNKLESTDSNVYFVLDNKDVNSTESSYRVLKDGQLAAQFGFNNSTGTAFVKALSGYALNLISNDTIRLNIGVGGLFNFYNNRLTNLATPTDNLDATTKGYVDNAIAASGGSGIVYPGGTDVFLRGDGEWTNELSADAGEFYFTLNNTNIDSSITSFCVSVDGDSKADFGYYKYTNEVFIHTNISGDEVNPPTFAIYTGSLPRVRILNNDTISFNNHSRLTDLLDPVDGQDAVTKNYLNNIIGGLMTTLTGAVTGEGVGVIETTLTPITTSQITDFNSSVVQFRLDEFALPTEVVSFNNQRLVGVGDPNNPKDAANKQYVDDSIITKSHAHLYAYNNQLSFSITPTWTGIFLNSSSLQLTTADFIIANNPAQLKYNSNLIKSGMVSVNLTFIVSNSAKFGFALAKNGTILPAPTYSNLSFGLSPQTIIQTISFVTSVELVLGDILQVYANSSNSLPIFRVEEMNMIFTEF
jgi:hypothetical protein